MPAPATNAELNDVILKSGVIEDARLKSYLKKLGESADGMPPDPAKLAGFMVRDGVLTYFQAEQLLQGKWKRFFIGKYKVLERLGVGGMGQVFLCEHKLMKRRVAVKVLPAAKSQDEAALQRFYREARAVAAVDHPNIVRAYDIDQDENLHFIVMEFVDGINFHDLVKRHGPMDVLRACHYIYGATVGLHHAHEMGLVHRDIKPANILVDRSGVVKILDMGLARFFHPDEDDHLTKKFDENVLGTADYLAPEQAIDSSTVDIRADIYGLGGTLYYMLTGAPPFADGTVAQKLLWHQTKPPKSVRIARPEVPEEVSAILDKMLAKDPADRQQTPAELMAALAPWVQTPIPPPGDNEMPHLSAAASTGFSNRAPAPGSGAPLVAASSIKVAATPAPLNMAEATQAGGKGSARPPSSLPAIPVSASHGSSPKTGASLQARPKTTAAGAPALWESLTNDTLANNLANADTANSKKEQKAAAKSATAKAASAKGIKPFASEKKSLLPWIIAAAVGLVFVLGLAATGIYYATKKPYEPPPPPTVPRESQTWYVSRNGFGPEQAHTRRTIQEALATARNGDTISIMDDHIDVPNIVFGYPKQKITLHIEAGNAAKRVVWNYKAPPGAKPPLIALDLTNMEDSTFENITFDVSGADIGIRIQGQFSGTTFQNVAIRGAKKSAFQTVAIDASEGKLLKLNKVRILPQTADKPCENAIDLTGAGNSNIEISECRLEGAAISATAATPKSSGLRISGNAANIVVRNNRFYNLDQGILFAGAGGDAKSLDLKIENNIFYSMKTAGINAEAALTLPGRSATIQRNLFVKTNELFKATSASPGVKAEQNGSVESTEGKTVNLKAEPVTGYNKDSNKFELGDGFLRGLNGARPVTLKDKIPVGIE